MKRVQTADAASALHCHLGSLTDTKCAPGGSGMVKRACTASGPALFAKNLYVTGAPGSKRRFALVVGWNRLRSAVEANAGAATNSAMKKRCLVNVEASLAVVELPAERRSLR